MLTIKLPTTGRVIHELKCLACGHAWFPRGVNERPLQCPRCKSASWATGRRRAPRRTAAEIEAIEDATDVEEYRKRKAESNPSELRTLNDLRAALGK